MKKLMAVLALAASCKAQTVADVIKRGAAVFANSCATAYCHGARGAASAAPRLVGRGFDQAYVLGVVTRGVPDTGMRSYANTLPRPDLVAVVAYVATLNGIADPTIGGAQAAPSSGPALTGEAARGAQLFIEAARSFGRCSTCHQVHDSGISVATPIAKVPTSVAELKALATPNVKTGAVAGESMPVLVLSEGKRNTVFYDLTTVPPVQRNAEPGSVKFVDSSDWRHSLVIGAYTDSELAAILTFLRTVNEP